MGRCWGRVTTCGEATRIVPGLTVMGVFCLAVTAVTRIVCGEVMVAEPRAPELVRIWVTPAVGVLTTVGCGVLGVDTAFIRGFPWGTAVGVRAWEGGRSYF